MNAARLFGFLILTGLLAPLAQAEAAATASVDAMKACTEKLANGQNRLGVKLPKAAVARLLKEIPKKRGKYRVHTNALLVDYTRSSTQKRAFMLDLKSCDVISSDYVIHGGSIYRGNAGTHWGDPNQDGYLDACVKSDGTRKNMTRPGLYVTAGCHRTSKSNWTYVRGTCSGVKLIGFDQTNYEAWNAGLVLHEHLYIPNDKSIKPTGQGCPAFPPGKLKALVNYGIYEGALVYVHAPQCTGG